MLPQVLGSADTLSSPGHKFWLMLRAGRDENRTKLQANPHVHQQHIVLAMLKQYAAGERVDLLDDYDFQARTITETELSLFSTKGTLYIILGEEKKCLLVEQLVYLRMRMFSPARLLSCIHHLVPQALIDLYELIDSCQLFEL